MSQRTKGLAAYTPACLSLEFGDLCKASLTSRVMESGSAFQL
jgi:hypothetical protein